MTTPPSPATADVSLKEVACADPDAFERDHPTLKALAYQRAEEHYKSMASWRRSDLRDICRENWPEFVEDAE